MIVANFLKVSFSIRLIAGVAGLLIASSNCFGANYETGGGDELFYQVSPYIGQYSYDAEAGSDDLQLTGIYGSVFSLHQGFEFAYDQFKYKSGDFSGDVLEKDYTFIYRTYPSVQPSYKLGFHRIAVTGVENTNVLIVGGFYQAYDSYGYKWWGLGTDFYRSKYSSKVGLDDKTANQLTFTGNRFLNPKKISGFFNFIASANVIDLNQTENESLKDFYTFFELTTEYSRNKVKYYAMAKFGDSFNAVEKGGFAIANQDKIKKQSYGAGFTYSINKTIYVDLKHEIIKVENLEDGVESDLGKSLLTLGFTF